MFRRLAGASADAGESGRVPAPTSVRAGNFPRYPPQQTNGPQGPNTSTPHRGECTYPAHPGFRPGLWSGAPTGRTGTRTNKPTGLRARMDERPGTCIRPVPGPNTRTAVAHSSLAGCLVGRMQYAPTLPAGGPSSTRPNLAGVPDAPGLFCVYESATLVCHYDTIISLYSL